MITTSLQFTVYSLHNKSSERQAGFTLVETLVSLVILSVALIPILNLSSDITKVNSTLQDNLVASGLAQEGVEVIRAIRDTNWFAVPTRAFDSGLSDNVYRAEWDSTALLPLSGNPVLNLDDGRYTYTGGVPTKFSRTITITKINAGELRAVSTVTWTERGGTSKSIGAESHLFNWK